MLSCRFSDTVDWGLTGEVEGGRGGGVVRTVCSAVMHGIPSWSYNGSWRESGGARFT